MNINSLVAKIQKLGENYLEMVVSESSRLSGGNEVVAGRVGFAIGYNHASTLFAVTYGVAGALVRNPEQKRNLKNAAKLSAIGSVISAGYLIHREIQTSRALRKRHLKAV